MSYVIHTLAIWATILQEEGAISKQFSAVRAVETFRMEMLPNGIQAVALNRENKFLSAHSTDREDPRGGIDYYLL